MRSYDSWKTTEPDREPSPGEHRPYDMACDCDECQRERNPPETAIDTRPRYRYRLPDGRVVRVIHDHGEAPRASVTYDTGGGLVVTAYLELSDLKDYETSRQKCPSANLHHLAHSCADCGWRMTPAKDRQ